MKTVVPEELNSSIIEKWRRHLRLQGLKEGSIKSKMSRLHAFEKYNNHKNLKNTTQDELEDFYLYRKERLAENTIWGEIKEVERFYKWLLPDRAQSLFSNIKPKRPKTSLPTENLLTQEDIRNMVEKCTNQRDRALIMILWDTGARIGEIMNLDVGNIEFDQYGGVCILDGKTGRRRARLIDSIADVQQWINSHPDRNNKLSPLFVNLNTDDLQRLSIRRCELICKKLMRKAQVSKRVHPHAFRHARATERANHLTEAQMNVRFGWTPGSGMSRIYVHLSGKELEETELKLAGLLNEDEIPTRSLAPKKCPRCGTQCAPDAAYCHKCSMGLSEDAALRQDRMHESVLENPEVQMELKEKKNEHLKEYPDMEN